ncbi:MAG: hypothetical protein NTW49_04590 [Bacteroidia bacterium]|nr:hypothetical protein [Bacteroidia bacterium]
MKTTRKKFIIIVERTDTGFSAYSEDYPIFTTGRTISDLINNAHEATNLFLEDEKVQITHENLKFTRPR